MRRINKSMTGRTGLALAACATLLLWQTGCKKKDAAKAEEAAKATAALAAGPAAETPVLDGFAGLAFAPANSVLAMAVDGPLQVLDRLGRVGLMKKYADKLKPVVEGSKTLLGRDLTDPAAWIEMGVDLTAKAGFTLHIDDELGPVGIVSGSLTDSAKFLTVFKEILAKNEGPLKESTEGDATFFANRDAVLVVMPKHLLMVFADADPLAEAKRLVTLDKSQSLASSASFTSTMKKLAYGAQSAAYVDFHALVTLGIGNFKKEESSMRSAPDAAAPDEPVAPVEPKGPDEKLKKMTGLFDKLMGKTGTFGMGANLSDTGIFFKGLYALGDGAQLLKMMTNMDAPTGIVTGLDKAPLYLVSTKLDLAAITAMVKEGVAAFGESDEIETGAKMVLGLTGIDLFALEKTFSGEIGFAVTGSSSLDSVENPEELAKIFGGAMVIGLADEAGLKSTVDRLMGAFGDKVADVVKRQENGDLSIAVPKWRTVHIRIGGGYLAASTDPAFFDRLGKGPGYGASIANSRHKALLTTGKAASITAMDWSLMNLVLLGGKRSDFHDKERDATGKLVEMRKELETLRKAKVADERVFAGKMFKGLGVVAGRAHIDGNDIVGDGGFYLNGNTPAQLVELGFEQGLKEFDPESPIGKFNAQREKVWNFRE
ncbi:MAG: hypothetical protein ACI9OJ_003266 [Myxococcota bacterium]|jgi:hypothetical protein